MAGLPLLVAYKEDEIPVLKVSSFKIFFPQKFWHVSALHMLGMVTTTGFVFVKPAASWPLSKPDAFELLQFVQS